MADWTEGRGERRRGKGKASEQKSDDDAARGREATSIGVDGSAAAVTKT